MKKFKKVLLVTGMVVTIAMGAVACGGKEMTCEWCGETKKCKQYEVLGEQSWMCNRCAKGIEEIKDMLQ